MPCPTQRPSAQQFRSPSDGSLHASKLWVAERSVEEAAPALIALPALQQGSRPSLQLCAGKTLPAQSSAGSPVGNTVVPSSGTRPCSPRGQVMRVGFSHRWERSNSELTPRKGRWSQTAAACDT